MTTNLNQPYYAFALSPVVVANDKYPRRSEASMVALNDGSCLLAYANHSGRSDNDRAPIAATILSADGEPSGDEWMIVPPPQEGLNAMSPALRRLPDGRLGMLYSYRMSVTEASRHFVTSEDEGRSWSKPVVVAAGEYKTGCHDRFTVLSSGRLLAPLHCTDNWNNHYLHVRVAFSDGMGQSWSLTEKLELPPVLRSYGWSGGWIESGCVEPGVAERADGSLLMTIRTAMGTQFCSESFDGGTSWSSPRSMEVISPQAPANLTRILGSDDLLLLWTPTYDPYANGGGLRNTIMACVSKDGGRSWPHADRRVLVHDSSRSVDYPSVLYRDDAIWVTLRVSSGPGVLSGQTSTALMRVPLVWFYGN